MCTYFSKNLPILPVRRLTSNTMTLSLCLSALLANDSNQIAHFYEKAIRVSVTSHPTADYIGNGFWIVLSPKSIIIEVRCKTGQTIRASHITKTVKTIFLRKLNLGCGSSNTHFQLPIHFQVESHLEPFQIFQLHQTFTLNNVRDHLSSVLSDNDISLPASCDSNLTTCSKWSIHIVCNQMSFAYPEVTSPVLSSNSDYSGYIGYYFGLVRSFYLSCY